MRITEVLTIPIDKLRHGVLGYLVLVKTDEGLVGLGEVAADCHPATVAFALRQMNLKGRDPLAIEGIWQHLYHGNFWRGGPVLTSAISGVEQALWDIKGKLLGVPVYQLLGGKLCDSIKLYTHTLFGGQSPEEFAASGFDSGTTPVFLSLKSVPPLSLVSRNDRKVRAKEDHGDEPTHR